MNRVLEIMPGALSWGTLFGLLFLSWKAPLVVALFIILYDLFWFLKTIYLYFHLRHSFVRMRKNMRTDWQEMLDSLPHPWKRVHHLVVLPMYKEPYDVVRASVETLSTMHYPHERMFILLATEARGGEEARATARRIESEYGKRFGGFLVTEHPDGIPGELPGKGSNESYAVKVAVEEMIRPSGVPIEDILISVFDVDTRPGADYFGILTHAFLASPHGARSSYQPVPVYTNNIYEVPVFARLIAFSCTFWQFMQQARPEQLVTFSSHSMPLKALIEVGYWHTDIVSEDSRIFFQCLEHFDGDWRVVPLLYPIYMDAVSGSTTWEAVKNLYKQQRRWAWGIENVSYVFRMFMKNKVLPLRKKLFWGATLIDGFHSWATSSFIIFFFGVLPNVLGDVAFRSTVASYNLPKLSGIIVNLSVFGIVTSAVLSIMLLPPKRETKMPRFGEYAYYLAQWFLIPVTFILFSAIPALEAQTRMMLGGKYKLGFWVTPKKTTA